MRIGSGKHTYEWIEDWARIPDTESSRASGRTHGVAVNGTGSILVFHEATPAVLVFKPNGSQQSAWGDHFPGAHGMTLVREGMSEYLWLTDYKAGEVVKTTLDGKRLMQLSRPEIAAYRDGRYAPTWVAVHEERHGGNGDVWVADGYGQSYVHRYDRAGHYLGSINGTEGKAGAFRCPHAVLVDMRKTEPELYIADRSNRRIQVYDLDGRYKRVFGDDIANCPCGVSTHGDEMLITEAPYRARLTILDIDDRLVCALGVNDEVCTMEGFPNSRQLVKSGKFNTPHAVTADPAGNLYVVEWITGGRITKLAKV